MFNVGMWAAAKDAGVLDGYVGALLRRDLHPWLSEAPHVRRPMCYLPHANSRPSANGVQFVAQYGHWLAKIKLGQR